MVPQPPSPSAAARLQGEGKDGMWRASRAPV